MKLLKNHKGTQNYQSVMILIFSLQKHFKNNELVKLIKEMMTQAQKSGTPSTMKAHLFIVLEFLFSQRSFEKSVLKETMTVMFNCEEILSEHLSNKIYVVSFLRAFLQLILNFYSQYPNEAKPYIPAFLGSILELFTDKGAGLDFGENLVSNELGLDAMSGSDDELKEQVEKNAFVSKGHYSGLAGQLFEMLIEHTFDSNLFSDLGSDPTEELNDIFANFDFRANVSHGNNGVASTSSKIFALMNYGLSERFSNSRPFICKMLFGMLDKIGSLQLVFSQAFHVNLGKMASILLSFGKTSKEADMLLGKIFELVDLPTAFNELSSQMGLNIHQMSILEKEEFSHLLYIFSRHCKNLDFVFFLQRIFPLLTQMTQKPVSQMSQIEELLLKKLYSSVLGFTNFSPLWTSSDQNLVNQVSSCILMSFRTLADEVTDLQTPFLRIFQNFLLSLLSVKEINPYLAKITIQQIKETKILGLFCVRVAKSERNLLEENCLQLIVRLISRDYINNIFEKNCERIISKLQNKEKIEKTLREGIIIGFIARACGTVTRDDQILHRIFSFITSLLQFKTKLNQDNTIKMSDKKRHSLKVNCLVLQLLTFLTPNVPFALYPRILSFGIKTSQNHFSNSTKQSSSLKIEGEKLGKNKKKEVTQTKYDQYALKFCWQLISSIQLNMSGDNSLMQNNSSILNTRKDLLFSLAEHFLPIVLVNIKSRNIKTRKNAKETLKKIVELEHLFPSMGKIRANSLSVSSVIAGLVGTSSYTKSCAIQGLGYLLKGFYSSFELNLKQSILELVLMLTRERNKEIFLAILKFLKTFVKLENGESIRSNKEAIRGTIFHEECELGPKFRAKIKGIIMILMRKLGREETSEIVGDQWRNMIRYVAKKITKARNKRRAKPKHEEEEESEQDIIEEEEKDFDVKMFLEEKKREVSKKKKLGNNTFNGFVGEIFRRYLAGSMGNIQNNNKIEEEVEEANDEEEFLEEFGDISKLKEFFNEGIIKSKKQEKTEKSGKSKKKGDIYFDEATGKLIITQKKITPKLSGKRKFSDFETDDAGLDSGSKNMNNLKRKRPREFTSKQKREQSELKFKKIISNVTKRNRHLNEAVHTIQESGRSYRNKSGGGDAALKNRVTPHAFIQFNPVAISKKLRQKARKAFEMVVNSRKKTSGALKNLKIKKK